MNAERLIELYDRIAEAPDAVSRLRRFVLDLAVRGKLVEQDPGDEPASELLKRIETGKAWLIKEGQIRKPRDLGNDVDEPFALPDSWCWCRLDSVGAIIGGGTPSASDAENFAEPGEGIPWLTPADLGGYSNQYISRGARDLSEKGLHGSSATLMPAGSVLFTSRAPIGYVAIARNPISTNQGFKSVVPHLSESSRFIALALKTFAPDIDKKAPGTTFKEVSGKIVAGIPFPLPPLAEQHRIVAKVDELMTLCDHLEETHNTRETTRDQLTTATLTRLTAPDTDKQSFRDHARFALDTLPALTTRPDQIKTLRQTILNLAVRGRLTHTTTGAMRSVGMYRKLQNGYAFKSAWFAKSGTRLLRNANVGHGGVRWDETVYLPESRITDFERFALSEGDIVLSLDRPFIATGTKAARVRKADLPALLLQRVGRFVEVHEGLSDDYLFLWVHSPHFGEQINPGRSNGVPHVSSKQVEAAEIYVPSLTEQSRIVDKVDELMALCDRLEASLNQAETKRSRLLESLLAEALASAQEEREAA